MRSDRDAEIVTGLLAAAGLTVSAEELDQIIAVYPLLRAQADGLYLPELISENIALSFDPAAYYA